LAVGLLVCWTQQTFGLVSMGMQTAIVDAYPVKMQFTDFFYTAVSITIITFLASYRPASIAARTEVKDFL
jgi:lipoprotein-releasing system permease protein